MVGKVHVHACEHVMEIIVANDSIPDMARVSVNAVQAVYNSASLDHIGRYGMEVHS
jgi:hypothetical protein